MKIPKAEVRVTRIFEELTPTAKGVTSKKMFGQPAAFVNGNLFMGVFGENLFVRLSVSDRTVARTSAGFAPFEPMPGRAMREVLGHSSVGGGEPSRGAPMGGPLVDLRVNTRREETEKNVVVTLRQGATRDTARTTSISRVKERRPGSGAKSLSIRRGCGRCESVQRQ